MASRGGRGKLPTSSPNTSNVGENVTDTDTTPEPAA
jgi:hypothetical protein